MSGIVGDSMLSSYDMMVQDKDHILYRIRDKEADKEKERLGVEEVIGDISVG